MKKHIKLMVLLFFTVTLIISTGLAKGEGTTFTFYQAKLSHVLQSLSKMTGIKMVTSAELGEQPISAYLENVSGEEAIDSILSANGLYREKMQGMEIYVVKKSGEPLIPLKSEIFFLQYAKAEDMGKILTPLVGGGGKVIVDNRTNSITVRENSEVLKEIKNIVISLDKTIPQVAIEAMLVELTTDSLKDLGIDWNIEGTFSGPAMDTSFPWQKSYTNKVISPEAEPGEEPRFILGRISLQTLTANIKILESKGEANILANPRVTTLNDSPATIKIITKTAISPETEITTTENRERVAGEYRRYEREDVGITLKVNPHVNTEGYIVLNVEPTVSSVAQSPIFSDALDIHERTAETKVMVKDGETLVIGGLLTKNTEEIKRKVPILGDILPFLFSRTDKQIDKTDLVIFLTPKIVTDEQASAAAQEEKKRMMPE
jgi:type IV pilus assembly protein PilQ